MFNTIRSPMNTSNHNVATNAEFNDFDRFFQKGLSLSNCDDHVQAAAQYREALRYRPDDAACRAMLGLCYARTRQFPEAEAELRRSIELDAGQAATHYNLGILFAE